MEDVEFYLRQARLGTDPRSATQMHQLALIAAMREVSALLTEVKDLLKEIVK